jgi:hypothetical protein
MRLSILFAFFAFSFAMAEDCEKGNFKIFAETAIGKEDLGCDDEVSTKITYGETLTLSVEPDTGTYTWTTATGTIIKTGSSFSPKFSISENPPESGVTEIYKVRKKGDSTKTIEVTILGRPTYTVSFDTDEDDDDTEIEEQEVMKDSLATMPIETATLTKEGYYFAGWDFDIINTPIVEDITITAIWKIQAYAVSFDTEGGTPNVPPQVVGLGGFAKDPKVTLTRTGYEFDGWNFIFDTTPITKDTIIKAKWKISNSFVGDTIVFKDSGYDLDTTQSRKHSKQYHYFVASPSNCEIKEKDTIKITITTKDPDIILKINGVWPGTTDGKGLRYEIPFVFGKLGNLNSNTLIYEWVKKDDTHLKYDTILIETPVPFKEPLIIKKWNNIWFVNNNKKTNGLNDSITEFKWFKNNNEIGNLQYYSATSSNPNDVYNVVMQTSKGTRVSTKNSTCTDPKEVKENINNEQTPKPALTKQVLGIKEKPLNKGSKVYNLNGKLTKETPAGVYIVKEE